MVFRLSLACQRNISLQSGLSTLHRHRFKSWGLIKRGLAGGVVIEDFNNDGHLDIMASNWGFHDQIQFVSKQRRWKF